MKKLKLMLVAVAALGLGACSATTETAKTDAKNSDKSLTAEERIACEEVTGSRVRRRC